MFQYSAITSYGLAALSGSITEDNILKVTRIEYGDGIIEELKTATTASTILEIIRHQTSLVNKKCDLSVYKIEKKENSDVRTIVGVVDQLSVVEDFNAREAAIYAEYNGQEILFAYFTAVAYVDGEKTDTSNYISKVALSVKPCYFVTNISMANSTEVDYIFDADLSMPTITPIEVECGYLLKIKDGLGEKTVEIKNRHLAGAGLKEEGDYLTAPVATQSADGIMSSSDKTKLDGIATGANKYIHPTTAGNKHIPTGGATGQILGHSESGTAEWTGRHDFIYTCTTVATTSAKTVKLPGFKLETGSCVRVVFTNGNSVASPTLNVNSTGAKEIVTQDGKKLTAQYGNLTAGAYDWNSNVILELMYDGTNWVVLGNPIVKKSIGEFTDYQNHNYELYIDGYKRMYGSFYDAYRATITLPIPIPVEAKICSSYAPGDIMIGGTINAQNQKNTSYPGYIKFNEPVNDAITTANFYSEQQSYMSIIYEITGYSAVYSYGIK